ncbi:MAG: tRNA adenosine(34) deaminase TadA [Planctomycetota bacterium]|jgi:tRNA(adenine34) deaminase|nr:tRNA adenosine(34) deaminase TadA [Planctomycetota bacterium]
MDGGDIDGERMLQAIRAASEAAEAGEVPVGAVIYRDGRLIARAHNQRETLQDPTAHAEILAITQAAAAIGGWRLENCVMYATLEPCAMCAGALVAARLPRLVYGAADPKAGACGSVLDVLGCEGLNHVVAVESGLLAEVCGRLLRDFFQDRRNKGRPSTGASHV